MLDHLIYGAIGFVLGGVLGGALVGRLVTNDMKKRLDELEERNRLLVDEVSAMRDERREEKEKKIEKLEKETKLDNYNSLRKRYVSSSSETEDDENDDEDEDEDDDLIEDEDDACDKIKMISEQQFNEEINYRDHEELTYYQIDGTLVDAANDIVTKEETVIGSEIMDIIDETQNDNLYALNDELDKLYDITIEHDASYMRDILGIN